MVPSSPHFGREDEYFQNRTRARQVKGRRDEIANRASLNPDGEAVDATVAERACSAST